MFRFLILILMMIGATENLVAQSKIITIKGKVCDESNVPIIGAYVLTDVTNKTITDVDGNFVLSVNENAKISVTYIGYESKSLYVNGRTNFNITLHPSNTYLPEVTVTSMLKKNVTFVFSPAEMEVVKDNVYIHTRYNVPDKLFFKDSRLILHPYLVNYTKKTKRAYTPVVLDGANYDILLKRGNVCGSVRERDYYSQYAKLIDEVDSKGLLNYVDSCTLDNINDKYGTEVYIKINTFCREEYRDTSIIAQGIVYPMRNFQFDGISYDLDNSYAPEQETLKFAVQGLLNLTFKPDDTKIYESDGNNRQELSTMRNLLHNIDQDKTKTLTYLSIKGFSSPDGSYKRNSTLSKGRIQSAVNAITKRLSDEAAQNVKVDYDAIIVPWDSVYAAMLSDSLEQAKELKRLISRTGGKHDEISWGYRYLKCRNLISKKYLPRFRKVEYAYEYEEMRTLNDDELNELYRKDKKNLTASEYWRYIYNHRDLPTEKRIKLMREVLELHPNLMIAANNLSALLNRENQPDTLLLKPFMNIDAPIEIFVNQAVAYFLSRDFEKANELVLNLPNTPKTQEVKAMAAAMNGDYIKAMEYYNDKESLNKAVLLLCLRKNADAYEFLHDLKDNSASAEYVRAIAANRNNDLNNAIRYLKSALALDPSLKKQAEIDGDVLDLLELID